MQRDRDGEQEESETEVDDPTAIDTKTPNKLSEGAEGQGTEGASSGDSVMPTNPRERRRQLATDVDGARNQMQQTFQTLEETYPKRT